VPHALKTIDILVLLIRFELADNLQRLLKHAHQGIEIHLNVSSIILEAVPLFLSSIPNRCRRVVLVMKSRCAYPRQVWR
jgi:hypothetical protein